ncbi:MAG: hypothetical protein ACI8W8_002092 [Rhodothermales bacterium]|jgi:hypothetical protein
MTRIVLISLLLHLLVGRAFADGFSAMPLEQVLLDTDVIILVEILENTATTTHRNKGAGAFSEAVVYTHTIKSTVLSTHLGKFTGAEYNTMYSLTLAKGVWLAIPGSGLEARMATGEKYVLMLKTAGDTHRLQRAETAARLDEVLRVRQKLDDEDRRVAKAQAQIPDGIYHYSDAAEARKVRLQGGLRVAIGELCNFVIVHKEMYARYNLFLLSLALAPGKPGRCVLIVGGKAYWLFDHHWAAGRRDLSSAERPTLYRSFPDRESAKAVSEFFDIAVTGERVKKAEQPRSQ